MIILEDSENKKSDRNIKYFIKLTREFDVSVPMSLSTTTNHVLCHVLLIPRLHLVTTK